MEAPLTPIDAPQQDPVVRPKRVWPRRLAIGCLGLVIVGVVGSGTGLLSWRWWAAKAQREAEQAQAEAAEKTFSPAQQALSAPPAPTYDIDETIRVVHGLDRAIQQSDSLDAWLGTLARQDYRDVAPEVLASRKEILDLLQPIYAKQTELEDQQAMWEMTSEMLLATLSVVSISGEASLVSPSGSLSVDRKQAQKLWADLKEEQADRKELQRELAELDQQLFDAMVAYGDVYYRYVEEWDRLSTLRDRAYLAAASGDWVAAEQSAKLAIAQAPKEREAHLLAAMAILEQGNEDRFDEARALLGEVIEEHPDQTAPALLLLGVLEARSGHGETARLNLQQAAAYYPKQSDQLLDMLDPYKMRAFLEKSREGGYITELYRSTMLGAGYFSPDLQLARLHFEEAKSDPAKFDDGARKVLDHFARRRAQGQWDFVIQDIAFCQELLGADFARIFPEDAWLDLQVSRPMLGGGLQLAVDNRSDRTLHNATLVLALHLTDQFPGQYVAVPAPETVPAVVAHDTTPFGKLDPALPEVAGKPKTVDDVVEHRAILITDEAVVWVDTDAFKLSESEEFRKAREAAAAGLRPAATPSRPAFAGALETLLGTLDRRATLALDSSYGADGVTITLPRELSAVHPVFRLTAGEAVVAPDENTLEGSDLHLHFPAVQNFDDEKLARPPLVLGLTSPLGDADLTWTPSGEGGAYEVAGVARR